MTPSPATARCLRCREPIAATDAFCPLCGTDARPPGGRRVVPPHAHDARGGRYCRHCGVSLTAPALDDDEEPGGFTPWPLVGAFVVTAYVLGAYWLPLPGHEILRGLWFTENRRSPFSVSHHRPDAGFPIWSIVATALLSLWFGAFRLARRG